jgi:hypothetical protein
MPKAGRVGVTVAWAFSTMKAIIVLDFNTGRSGGWWK